MAEKNLRFTANLSINSKARGFAKKARGATEVAMRRVLRDAERRAKENVAPGKGPSPHMGGEIQGHNFPYEDTGNLAKSVRSAIWLQGFLTEGSVFTDMDYGVFLEVGWRTKAKTFYRYPWLKPAFMESLKLLPKYAAETFRTQMQDFDEERLVDGAALESWASAAESWSKHVQSQMRVPIDTPEVEYEEALEEAKRRVRRKRTATGEARRDKARGAVARERKRRESLGKSFDVGLAKATRRSGEAQRRGRIAAEEQRKRYEQHRGELDATRRRLEKEREQRASLARARQTIKEREAQRRLDEANKKLADAVDVTPKKRRRKKNP